MMNRQLTQGQPVYDAEGNELGTVKELRGQFFKVDAPMAPDYWLHTDSLRDSGSGMLTVVADAERYDEPDATVTGTRRTTTRDTMSGTAATDMERVGDEHSMKLREERLRVEKEGEKAGEVRLGKRVTEHEQTVNVPLREERVVVERRPASGEATGGEITDTDETIEVPVTRERAKVGKETVVREEVTARKEATERSEPVKATTRREELEVEGEEEILENPNLPRRPEYQREETRRR